MTAVLIFAIVRMAPLFVGFDGVSGYEEMSARLAACF
jgi:hypothetical protein